MGHRFYESTVPALVVQLKLLNENLERLIATQHHDPVPRRDNTHGTSHDEDETGPRGRGLEEDLQPSLG